MTTYKPKEHGYTCPHCINKHLKDNNNIYPTKPHWFASVPTLRSHFTRFHKGADKVKTKDVIILGEKIYDYLRPKQIVHELPDDSHICLPKLRTCIVCLEEKNCGVVVPCGHTNLCSDCATTVLSLVASAQKCPCCRQQIKYYWEKPKIFTNQS